MPAFFRNISARNSHGPADVSASQTPPTFTADETLELEGDAPAAEKNGSLRDRIKGLRKNFPANLSGTFKKRGSAATGDEGPTSKGDTCGDDGQQNRTSAMRKRFSSVSMRVRRSIDSAASRTSSDVSRRCMTIHSYEGVRRSGSERERQPIHSEASEESDNSQPTPQLPALEAMFARAPDDKPGPTNLGTAPGISHDGIFGPLDTPLFGGDLGGKASPHEHSWPRQHLHSSSWATARGLCSGPA
ncbi:hypothetical protein GGR56DRAFT_629048 [Xylariaceae sp. FL0804]|nr:hypothetical protein GGR56DRAFT_629048 [Xylariaceae sp. FL0804]